MKETRTCWRRVFLFRLTSQPEHQRLGSKSSFTQNPSRASHDVSYLEASRPDPEANSTNLKLEPTPVVLRHMLFLQTPDHTRSIHFPSPTKPLACFRPLRFFFTTQSRYGPDGKMFRMQLRHFKDCNIDGVDASKYYIHTCKPTCSEGLSFSPDNVMAMTHLNTSVWEVIYLIQFCLIC